MNRPSRSIRRSLAPFLTAAFAAVLVLLFAVPASAQNSFVITGHGFGHGIGMSQYGAKSLAEHGWSYSNILKHYYKGAGVDSLGYAAGSTAEPTMRVAIQRYDYSKTSWSVRANNGDLWVSWEGMPSGGELKLSKGVSYTFLRSGGDIIVRDQSLDVKKTFTGANWVRAWERDTSKPRYVGLTQVTDPSGPWDWSNVLYNGSISIEKQSASTTGLFVRNWVYMEDYVRAVVPRESPASWHQEALKAQAVAARSYAYVSRSNVRTYDVYCTTSSQVYNGWGLWVSGSGNVRHSVDSLVDPAVSATTARVMKSGSTIVQTFFFSTSGGYTEDISNVWAKSQQQPYFSGVSDPYEHTAGSPRHDWGPFVYTAAEVRTQLLSAGLAAEKVPSTITDMYVTKRGVSGRVLEMTIVGTDKTTTLSWQDGDIGKVRNALCKSYDTWFYIDQKSERIAGDDRYETAVELTKDSFPSANEVVVANGQAFADALAASGLAGALECPILLVSKDSLPSEVSNEITRLGAKKVYVIGGTAVVSDAVQQALGKISGVTGVERVWGRDRYETGLRIAQKIKSIKGTAYSGTAIVVSGVSFPDAVVAAPWAYRADTAVILVNNKSAPATSRQAVRELGATSVQVVGGPAVVPDAVAASLGVQVKRVASGLDRYDTAAKLATYLTDSAGFGWDSTHIASGESLVDALAGGPLAGKKSGPILFAAKYSLPTASTTALNTHRLLIDDVYIFGGPGALNNVVEARIEEALEH